MTNRVVDIDYILHQTESIRNYMVALDEMVRNLEIPPERYGEILDVMCGDLLYFVEKYKQDITTEEQDV